MRKREAEIFYLLVCFSVCTTARAGPGLGHNLRMKSMSHLEPSLLLSGVCISGKLELGSRAWIWTRALPYRRQAIWLLSYIPAPTAFFLEMAQRELQNDSLLERNGVLPFSKEHRLSPNIVSADIQLPEQSKLWTVPCPSLVSVTTSSVW